LEHHAYSENGIKIKFNGVDSDNDNDNVPVQNVMLLLVGAVSQVNKGGVADVVSIEGLK
jgi:hypothetical protein